MTFDEIQHLKNDICSQINCFIDCSLCPVHKLAEEARKNVLQVKFDQNKLVEGINARSKTDV